MRKALHMLERERLPERKFKYYPKPFYKQSIKKKILKRNPTGKQNQWFLTKPVWRGGRECVHKVIRFL